MFNTAVYLTFYSTESIFISFMARRWYYTGASFVDNITHVESMKLSMLYDNGVSNYCKNCYKRFYNTKVRHETIMDPIGSPFEEGKAMPEREVCWFNKELPAYCRLAVISVLVSETAP